MRTNAHQCAPKRTEFALVCTNARQYAPICPRMHQCAPMRTEFAFVCTNAHQSAPNLPSYAPMRAEFVLVCTNAHQCAPNLPLFAPMRANTHRIALVCTNAHQCAPNSIVRLNTAPLYAPMRTKSQFFSPFERKYRTKRWMREAVSGGCAEGMLKGTALGRLP